MYVPEDDSYDYVVSHLSKVSARLVMGWERADKNEVHYPDGDAPSVLLRRKKKKGV